MDVSSDDAARALHAEQSAEADVLYRTARASQLRRRPAIRSADRGLSVGTLPPDLASDVPDEVAHAKSMPAGSKAIELRCGSGQTHSTTPAIHKPYPLPLLPPSLKRKYSESFAQPPSRSASNGCGEVLDFGAYPLPALGAWSSVRPRNVASLDDQYLSSLSPEESVRPLGTLPCGCMRQLCGCTTCGNVVGTVVVQLCNAHHASNPMSSRDFPVRQGVHLFFPSHVTATPDYEFPPSASGSRARTIASSVEAWSLPNARRRRTGVRAQEDGLPAIETLRESILPRSQRGAAWVSRSPFGDDVQENDQFNVEPFLDQHPTTRPPTPPPGDEPGPSSSANAWLAIRASRLARTRPTSPSVLSVSSASDAEAPPGASVYPLPRDTSRNRIDIGDGSNGGADVGLGGSSLGTRRARTTPTSARQEPTEPRRTGDPFAATLSAATGAFYAPHHHEEPEHSPSPWPSDYPINPIPLRSRRSMFSSLRRSRSSSSDTLLAPADIVPEGEAHPMGSLPMVRRHSRESRDDAVQLPLPQIASADARQPIVLPLPVQQTRGLDYPSHHPLHGRTRIGSSYSTDNIPYADPHAISVASAEAESTEDAGLVTGEVDCDGEIA